jgi:hypothetical protein
VPVKNSGMASAVGGGVLCAMAASGSLVVTGVWEEGNSGRAWGR